MDNKKLNQVSNQEYNDDLSDYLLSLFLFGLLNLIIIYVIRIDY